MKGIERQEIARGVTLYHIPADRFKTVGITVNLYRPLSSAEATKNALLPRVLKCGCEGYDAPHKLNRALENLYGATLSAGVNKKGEATALTFRMEYVAGRYLDEPGIDEKALTLLCDVIQRPALENGMFMQEYLSLEKENLKNIIEGRINDKREYAQWRCYEEMCRKEAYGVSEYGDVTHLESISNASLYAHYQDILSSRIDVFVCGEADMEMVSRVLGQRFAGAGMDKYPSTQIVSEVGEVRHVTDELDVEQGKLSLGFRTGIAPTDDRYYSLALYNSILGSGAHSKLFNNVREKLSLAYYVFSRLERFKGTMMISSGIEIPSYQAAYDEIMAQLAAVQAGRLEDWELEGARSTLLNAYASMGDSQGKLENFYLGQAATGQEDTPELLAEQVRHVTAERIFDAMQTVSLDTVYFLKGKETAE